ncbi:MAG: DUF354 domain-containing protein [candidate division KSB1 bacterium]|nr:DUF354 domain-containing protein [candidate division KSB1 bacterium]MDZ7318049.1 DUF354 domain-containing protein [candidate division KSB1 bacterium]MDZ7341329.1 DUF354 domain-containing protein [candidate division KSB1 bacterium]
MRIWVDFENSPHVLILKPIVEALQRQQHQVIMTARDCSQTIELARLFQLEAKRISHHHGRQRFRKLLGHLSRIVRLAQFIRKQAIDVAVSHGSRSQIIAAGLNRLPTFVLWDYEYASLAVIHHYIHRLAIPEVISIDAFRNQIEPEKIIQYPGIKEHIYAGRLLGQYAIEQDLPKADDKIIITIRPPAFDAHYISDEEKGEKLFQEVLRHLSHRSDVLMLVLARTRFQEQRIRHYVQEHCQASQIIFPKHAANGLNIIWHSDLIIGGGGTMNREAAVLGVPVYSIFPGRLGAVDRFLQQSGKLKIIRQVDDLNAIQLQKRPRPEKPPDLGNGKLLDFLIEKIIETGS